MRILSRTVILVVVNLAFLPALSLAQRGLASAEQELFKSINRERQAHRLPSLKWNDALAIAARRHAAMMARQGALSHQFPGEPTLPGRANQAGAHFVWLSENVAEGPNASLIHTQFVQSPKHYGNILDADMNSIGIGIVERSGQLFAVEDFSKSK